MLFLPRGVYQPRPARDASWNRGAYLVQSLGHCGSCHTPRGNAYEEKGYDETASQFLAGGVNDHWFAANLTGDMGSGVGRVSEEELVDFMKTGHGGGLVAYGSMVQTVEDSLQYLSDDDLHAIARYLKSLPPRHGSGNFEPDQQEPESAAGANHTRDVEYPGHAVYATFCARCHRVDGSGVPSAFPKLAGNPSLLNEDTTSLIRLLVEGGNSPRTLAGPPRQQMPGFGRQLTDIQIAQVLTYIRTSWGNDAGPVTTNDVAVLREEIHK
jgi:mono/diheme cytochrome c family protein